MYNYHDVHFLVHLPAQALSLRCFFFLRLRTFRSHVGSNSHFNDFHPSLQVKKLDENQHFIDESSVE